MWTVRGLFAQLCDPAHLERALALTVRGKRRRPAVAWALFRREALVAELAASLADGTWRPRGARLLQIRDPKPRLICCVPVEDRVVHTALVLLLTPTLTRPLRPEAMACRPGLGAHRAVLALWGLLRRHRYALHLDIRAYFPSVDHDILRGLLARRVRDRPFLDVMDRVLEADRGLYDRPEARAWAGLTPDWPPPGRGLPIGAATSQALAAHLYLNDLDHHVKRVLRAPGYVRYVDDLFLFADSRAALRAWRAELGVWLLRERGLRLKHPNAPILSCAGHLDGLGYRITRSGLTVRPRALRRLTRRARLRFAGRPGPDLARSFASSAGVVLF